jgi:hypothetical protein
LRWADLIERQAVRLDALDALEMGKPVGVQAFNARLAAEFVRFNAELADKIQGETFTSDSSSTVIQRRIPRGVVAAIVPWNFPTFNVVLKAAPALAAGNSVVLKPSELASQAALVLADLALEAGLPPGVLNVVPGRGDTVGRCLAEHMDVDMVTFTGSSAVGKLIVQYAGRSNMKVVSAECGGKSPHIVFDDGLDLDLVAGHIAHAIVLNQGQVCSVGSRLLVERGAERPLLEKITAHLAKVVAGDPQLPATSYGPVASQGQMERVLSYIAAAKAEGAELVLAGDEQAVLAGVPESEGEHSTKFREASLAPPGISLEQNFGVGVAGELRAGPVKLAPNVAEVIDLSVVNDPVAGFRIVHGLMPERRKIEDGEAPVSQADFNWFWRGVSYDHRAGVVGAAVREGRGGALEHVRGDLGIARDDAEDSTH